jgi:PPM family protein phosphatase
MSGDGVTCMQCGAPGVAADRFCEECGTILSGARRVAIPRPSPSAQRAPCADCGNDTYADEYCTVCGQRRAGPDRDQATLDGIVLITDRGLEHSGNEDAAAAGIVGGRATAIAVCDGVSSSAEAHTAAVSASTAGVEAMLRALAASSRPRSAVLAGLTDAAMAAATAGLGSTDVTMAPSCTYAAAVVVPNADGVEIAVGNVGDSRVYWLPEPPGAPQCLTVDDSLAQEMISAGVAADSEAVQAGAHTLTRWLGADAETTPWSDTSVWSITTAEPGVLLLCTDGLWNYLPEADDIAAICAGHDADAAARALVDYALGAGGHDNVTVAVIPIGGPS